MNLTENQKQLEVIRKYLNDHKEYEQAFDINAIDKAVSLGNDQKNPQLRHFFGLEESGSYSIFLKHGLRSLRKGFYKLCSPPFYNTTISPATFAADVLYYNPESNCNKLIKYRANIGPMINRHFNYESFPDTHIYSNISEIPLLNKFDDEKHSIGTKDDHYYKPKENFFNALYTLNKVFLVTKSTFHLDSPDEPRPKKVNWGFIDF